MCAIQKKIIAAGNAITIGGTPKQLLPAGGEKVFVTGSVIGSVIGSVTATLLCNIMTSNMLPFT